MMGVSRPRTGGITNATMNPDEYKKRCSGFWSHEYRADSMETIWRCNIPVLHDTVRSILMDQRESRLFEKDPHSYLDTRFGEGTAYCYFYKHWWKEKYIDMRTPDHFMIGIDPARNDGADSMAYNIYTSTTTGATATTDTVTAASIKMAQQELLRRQGRYFHENKKILWPGELDKFGPSVKKAESHISFKKKLVRTLPFVHGGDSLVATLQREFDHWAGNTMKELFG